MRKNGFVVMGHLLKLVTPLAHIMAFTITMGTLGFLAAIFIMVLGAMGLVNLLNFDTHLSFSGILTALEPIFGVFLAVLLLNEEVSLVSALGIIIIVVSALGVSLLPKWLHKEIN